MIHQNCKWLLKSIKILKHKVKYGDHMNNSKKTNKEERVKVGIVVDDQTGVILNNIYEGDKIITPKQQEYVNKYITNFQKKEAFVKVFTNPITALFKELPTKEFAVAMAIMPFISYKDGILKYDGKIADVRTISEQLGENYDVFRKTISSLVKKDVLGKVERQSDTYQNKTKQCICVNPFIYLRGQDLDREIHDKFVNSKWANIDKE